MQMGSEPTPPKGVELYDPEDTNQIRGLVERSLVDSVDRYVNGYSYGGVRFDVRNIRMADKEKFSEKEVADAKMKDRLLARRLRADVRLVDEETGSVLDERKGFTLMKVPYLTDNGTFVNNGSEFAPIMQSRLLAGSYARKRNNGELENHFNVRPGTGQAMRVIFRPEKSEYRVKVGSSDLHAYSMFKDLGVSDDELKRRWGSDVFEANKAGYRKGSLDKVYTRTVPKWERDAQATPQQKMEAVKKKLSEAQVAKVKLQQNLPNLYSMAKAASWRKTGAAIDMAAKMVKEASRFFNPDLTPDQVLDMKVVWDFDMQKYAAEFEPDMTPGQMRETYNSIYGNSGPQLASMNQWPERWLDDQDSMGWLQWYQNYDAGRRTENDEKQIKRWKQFKARHGAQFVKNPTPRRAFALQNWAVNPIKLLPEEKREGFAEQMESYRRKEYMKWYVRKHDFDETQVARLREKARDRGANVSDSTTTATEAELMTLAAEGYIKPEDLK